MWRRLWAFIICFCVSLWAVAFLNIWDNAQPLSYPSQLMESRQKPCNYGESKVIFSKKHYFLTKQTEGLLGKRISNLKCGKIKCAIGSENCSNVEIGELGTIKSLQPRFGFNDYLLVVEWDRTESWRAALAEQNPEKLVSYIGNDKSFEFVK